MTQGERGTVTQVTPSLLVRLDSSDTATPAVPLGAYVAVVNDRVAVIRLDKQLLALGKVP